MLALIEFVMAGLGYPGLQSSNSPFDTVPVNNFIQASPVFQLLGGFSASVRYCNSEGCSCC
jgi:hypothetical protein